MSAASETLRDRLKSPRERPLLLGPSLREVVTPTEGDASATLAMALRRAADTIIALQRSVVDAGAELVVAPTAGTTAPALHATGQAYRAAALTAAAVDLTRDGVLASGRGAVVLGEVPGEPGARGRAEARAHVERLATSAIDGVLVDGADLDTTRAVAAAAAEHDLPVIVEIDADDEAQVRGVGHVGPVSAIIVRGDDAESIGRAIEQVRARCPAAAVGARVMAPRDDAQLAIAHAWSLLGTMSLAIVGVGGSAALFALPALVELARASRVTVF